MHRRLLLFLLFFSLFAKAQENSFKIYSVAARQEISFEQLSQELTKIKSFSLEKSIMTL